MGEVKDIKHVNIREDEEQQVIDAIKYLTEETGMDLSTVYEDGLGHSLLPILMKPTHVLCISVVKSNYDSVKRNVVEFENQDIVNYVIGHNLQDKSFRIGDIVHFGSNVVPLEVIYDGNVNDVDYIREQMRVKGQAVVDASWFKSAAGAKVAIELADKGVNVADKYVNGSESIKLVKIMEYNSALISGVSPFAHKEDVKLHTKLR